MIEKNIRSWFTVTEKKKAIARDLSIMAAVISFVVLIVYVLNDIYPFGDGTIARGDMVQQTIPAGMYYVWDILHGQASPFFTWNSAFGMNISGASSLGAAESAESVFIFFYKGKSGEFCQYPYDTQNDCHRFLHVFLFAKV